MISASQASRRTAAAERVSPEGRRPWASSRSRRSSSDMVTVRRAEVPWVWGRESVSWRRRQASTRASHIRTPCVAGGRGRCGRSRVGAAVADEVAVVVEPDRPMVVGVAAAGTGFGGHGCGQRHQDGLDELGFLQAGVALDPDPAEGVGGEGEVAGTVGAAFLEVLGQVGVEQQPVGVEVLGDVGEAAVQVGGVVGRCSRPGRAAPTRSARGSRGRGAGRRRGRRSPRPGPGRSHRPSARHGLRAGRRCAWRPGPGRRRRPCGRR